MSVYDPLGLIASFVIHGNVIVQEVWWTDTSWDSQIPADIAICWKEWTATLNKKDKLRIPRCYFSDYDPKSLQNLELHVFVVASEQANRGQVRVGLASSKTHHFEGYQFLS